jgi:hypothetical protein
MTCDLAGCAELEGSVGRLGSIERDGPMYARDILRNIDKVRTHKRWLPRFVEDCYATSLIRSRRGPSVTIFLEAVSGVVSSL